MGGLSGRMPPSRVRTLNSSAARESGPDCWEDGLRSSNARAERSVRDSARTSDKNALTRVFIFVSLTLQIYTPATPVASLGTQPSLLGALILPAWIYPANAVGREPPTPQTRECRLLKQESLVRSFPPRTSRSLAKGPVLFLITRKPSRRWISRNRPESSADPAVRRYESLVDQLDHLRVPGSPVW